MRRNNYAWMLAQFQRENHKKPGADWSHSQMGNKKGEYAGRSMALTRPKIEGPERRHIAGQLRT
jgi:hypothetical protein